MIREADFKDINELSKVLAIYKNDFLKLYNLETIFKNSHERIFVYTQNNLIIGFIYIEIVFETVNIVHLFVLEEYRRKKVATLLLDYIFDLTNNVNNYILEVNENNIAAIKTYEKLGFETIYIREKYYNGENALIMQKEVSYE